MNRRSFLGGATGAALSAVPMAAAPIPVIDTHIHLFDTERPGGVPWPPKDNAALYKPALPDRYRKLAVPHGIVGAIEVEASPLLEDNQWVLDVAAKDTIVVGTVGNLAAGTPEFAKQLERFHKNRLFRGIRFGNLWGRDLSVELKKPAFLSDIKLLSRAGLSLDTANQTPELIAAVVQLTDSVPDLRVVIDHLPQLRVPTGTEAHKSYQAGLKEIHKRPQIFVKLSAVYRKVDGKIATELSAYKGALDEIYGVFGEDRVIYGSDWPNSDNWKPYADVFRIINEYINTKGSAAAEKFFWKNSVKAYRWIKRDASQPSA